MANEAPPAWAQSLLTQLQQLQSQQLSMQAALTQLQATGPSTQPPAYPDNVSPDAVAALAKDPRLPGPLQAFVPLLKFALPHALSDEDLGTMQATSPYWPPCRVGRPGPRLRPGPPARRPPPRPAASCCKTGGRCTSARRGGTMTPPCLRPSLAGTARGCTGTGCRAPRHQSASTRRSSQALPAAMVCHPCRTQTSPGGCRCRPSHFPGSRPSSPPTDGGCPLTWGRLRPSLSPPFAHIFTSALQRGPRGRPFCLLILVIFRRTNFTPSHICPL